MANVVHAATEHTVGGAAVAYAAVACAAMLMLQVKLLAVRSVKTRRFGALSWQKFAQMLVVAVLGGMFWCVQALPGGH